MIQPWSSNSATSLFFKLCFKSSFNHSEKICLNLKSSKIPFFMEAASLYNLSNLNVCNMRIPVPCKGDIGCQHV